MTIVMRAKTRTEFDHEMVWGTIGLLVLLAARFYPFHLLPLKPCAFLAATGWPCPTCGMTRCFMAVSGLDLGAAWALNPLGMILCLATVCYVAYAAAVVIGRLPRIRLSFHSLWEVRALVAAVLILLVADWLYLLLTWPHNLVASCGT